ncbi:hypothetical protein Nepgr_028203 [Nepenthes gracilis]|uniref:Uncharacterized protein n=1 Tax=Nepenthes gracilis TaxID=150966 RepID=A0AAD3T9V8_NEPGR|nr:hypothetical protein Nepgr_028203 [Nepenthes gracilis]
MDGIEFHDDAQSYVDLEVSFEQDANNIDVEDDNLQTMAYVVSRMKSHISVHLIFMQVITDLYRALLNATTIYGSGFFHGILDISLPEKTKEFHELQTAVPPHADWPSAKLDGEPLATVLNTGNTFHLSLPANPSTSEQILSFKPAKDSGGADLAELGKTHVKFSDLGSLCGDDEAPWRADRLLLKHLHQ